MRVDQDARDADGEMTKIEGGTDVANSSAAEVNRPPVGTHEVDGTPFEDVDGDVSLDREYPSADD